MLEKIITQKLLSLLGVASIVALIAALGLTAYLTGQETRVPIGATGPSQVFPDIPSGFVYHPALRGAISDPDFWQIKQHKESYSLDTSICRSGEPDATYYKMEFHPQNVIANRYPDDIDNSFIKSVSVNPLSLDFTKDFGSNKCLTNKLHLSIDMYPSFLPSSNKAAVLYLKACYVFPFGVNCQNQGIILGELPSEATPTPTPEKVNAVGRVWSGVEGNAVWLEGATVEVESVTGSTNSVGLFNIPNVPKKPGHPNVAYHLRIKANNHQTLDENKQPIGRTTSETIADFGNLFLLPTPTSTPIPPPNTPVPPTPTPQPAYTCKFCSPMGRCLSRESNIPCTNECSSNADCLEDDCVTVCNAAYDLAVANAETIRTQCLAGCNGGSNCIAVCNAAYDLAIANTGSEHAQCLADCGTPVTPSPTNTPVPPTISPCPTLDAPTGFTVNQECLTGNQAKLTFSWNDANNENGYRLYRNTTLGLSQINGDLAANQTTYEETMSIPTCQIALSYFLSDFNSCGESNKVEQLATDCCVCPTIAAPQKVNIQTAPPIGANAFLAFANAADINDDGAIDGADASTLVSSWGKTAGETGYNSNADLNNDGKINAVDASILVSNWTR